MGPEGGQTKDGLYWFKCPYCGKVIYSKWLRQALFNMETHIIYCKKRPRIEEIEEGEKK